MGGRKKGQKEIQSKHEQRQHRKETLQEKVPENSGQHFVDPASGCQHLSRNVQPEVLKEILPVRVKSLGFFDCEVNCSTFLLSKRVVEA